MTDEDKKAIQKQLLEKNIAQLESQVEQFTFTLGVAENTLTFLRSQLEALNGSNG